VLVTRRDLLKLAATAPAAVSLGVTAASLQPPSASAAPLGILLDYAAGVIPANDIRAVGAAGAIRYVSDRRPGGAWMLGKPMQLAEARDLHQNGLKVVSCYQFGKQDTADWLGGEKAGIVHGRRGWQLHTAAGGPINAPVYASIDDDPTYEQYKAQVAPYLRGRGYTHPAANLHQVEIDKRKVGGVGVDINQICKAPVRSVGLTHRRRCSSNMPANF
jgi:hypothetical protein